MSKTPSSIWNGEMPIATDNLSMVSIFGVNLPLSYFRIVESGTPTASPTCFCVIPAFARANFRFSQMRFLSIFFSFPPTRGLHRFISLPAPRCFFIHPAQKIRSVLSVFKNKAFCFANISEFIAVSVCVPRLFNSQSTKSPSGSFFLFPIPPKVLGQYSAVCLLLPQKEQCNFALFICPPHVAGQYFMECSLLPQ